MSRHAPPAEPHEPELSWLLSAGAVRQSAERIYAEVRNDGSEHFLVDETKLPRVVDFVSAIARAAYPNLDDVPYHSRLAHFEAGGIDRLAEFSRRIVPLSSEDQLRSLFELIITSVLLDAGAGASWRFTERESGQVFERSEGLAVASYRWFISGALSSDPRARPCSADAERLSGIDDGTLSAAFQAGEHNPLEGAAGRALLLRRLGTVTQSSPWFRGAVPRPGNLADRLRESAHAGPHGILELPATAVLDAVLNGLGEVWPGRERLGNVNLGDVWRHSRFGHVPFHKLSQWLSYSLCDALERFGWVVTELDELTGLAEYRNGGLFVDLGVLVPRDPAALQRTHSVDSDLVIEWRASTIALLDRTAAALRRLWGSSPRQLPLAKVLQAGTWAAGRKIAAQLRPDASPPIRIQSDGTVF